MTATGSAQNWRSAAACLLADPDLFFPISSTGPAEREIARAMPGDREKSIAAGASDYVTKPVDTDELLACMERWLTRR